MHTDWREMKDIISLLVGDRDEKFPYERAVRLCQFQTWIYCPNDSTEAPEEAGLLAATLILRYMDQGPEHGIERPSRNSESLTQLFKRDDYRSLYDSVIGELGGWTELAECPSPFQFDEQFSTFREHGQTTARLIEYQFRYVDHGGDDKKKKANISHAMFFLHKDKPSTSGKTLRARWRTNKYTSVFVYVSERFGFNFWPPSVQADDYGDRLVAAAANVKRSRRFFETCAYVAETLASTFDFFDDQAELTSFLKARRPKTIALSPLEMERMKSYKHEYQKMRDS